MTIALIRTVILYFVLVIGIRLMGKRQVGELEPAELVLALVLSDIAAVPMQDFGIPLLYGIIPIITLLCLTMILSVVTMRSVRLRALLCGKPSIVIQNGKLRQNEMKKVRMTVDELTEELRLQGVTDPADVEYAILETSGQLSILLKSARQPATAGQLGVAPPESPLPAIVISDGRVLDSNLKSLGFDRNWLAKQLKERNCPDPRAVFLMTADRDGKIYFASKEG